MHFKLYSLFFLLLFLLAVGCGSDDDGMGGMTPPPPPPTNVNVNLAEMPYDSLSDYRFFSGDEMADLMPNERVLAYKPISELFSDYAKKSRFVWMPEGTAADVGEDGNIVDFPDGTVLIKTFYYDHVQPADDTRLIETRILYKMEGEWKFADYVWNDEQTEATFDLEGSTTQVEFLHDDGEAQVVTYRIPSEAQCLTCHKIGETPIPIGPKPQNLNSTLSYPDGSNGNQLSKWYAAGYLSSEPDLNVINTVVDYDDPSMELELRARSYLDINCAHCHREDGHCDYRPIRLAYSETALPINLGICVQPQEFIDASQIYIVNPGNEAKSAMYYRLSTNAEKVRMPLLGRTVIHEEGLALVENWITSLTQNCN